MTRIDPNSPPEDGSVPGDGREKLPAGPATALRWSGAGLGALAVVLAVLLAPMILVVLVALVAVAAAVAAVLGSTRNRWFAAVSVALAAIAVVVSVVISPAPSGSGAGGDPDVPTPPSASPSQTATRPPSTPGAQADLPEIGDTSTNDAGVALVVDGMECGLSSAGEGTAPPSGQFCVVEFSVTNDSQQVIDILATDFSGQIGDSRFESVPGIGRIADDMFTTTVLPEGHADGVLFFDVPSGSSLEALTISGPWFEVTVSLV